MIATIKYVTQKFHEYNVMMFGGELPVPAILASRARTYLGRYECDVRRKLFGRTERFNHRIRINTVHDFPEEEVDDIIIHEMIHYFISFKGLRDTSAHGQIFRSMMREINTRFGRNITISKRRTKEMEEQDTRIKRHYLCVMTLPPDATKGVAERTAFTPVTGQGMFVLWEELPKAFGATSATWYVSLDPFFNSYRKVSASRGRIPRLRTYPLEKTTLEEHLQTAERLERRGNTIVPIKK